VVDLLPTLQCHYPDPEGAVSAWVRQFVDSGGVDTQELLVRITRAIKAQLVYQPRAIHGTQAPTETLALGSGTCRDFALLMIEAVRSLGMAARFVTGYLYDPSMDEAGRDAGPGARPDARNGLVGSGATHAWVQVYLPGAGWVEFDPTNGLVGGAHLIRVAVARDPRQAMPLSGSYHGYASDFIEMLVDVRVTAGARS
jgi:transglutaminase-like putative cysteine protease